MAAMLWLHKTCGTLRNNPTTNGVSSPTVVFTLLRNQIIILGAVRIVQFSD